MNDMQFTSRRQSVLSIGKVVLRRALTVGLLHGIVSTLLTVLALTALAGGSGMLTLLSFPIACAFFLIAGLLVARQTQRVVGGTLAGVWTALISRLFSTFLVAIFNLVYLLPRQPQSGGQVAPLFRLAPFFVLEFLYLCLDAGLGAGFGALGGLLGKDSEQEEMFPVAEPAVAPSSPSPYIPPSSPLPPEQPVQSTGSTKAMRPSDDPNPYGTPFFPPPYPVSPDSLYEDLYEDRPDYE
jgi:hypothetical protein